MAHEDKVIVGLTFDVIDVQKQFEDVSDPGKVLFISSPQNLLLFGCPSFRMRSHFIISWGNEEQL